MVHRAVFVVAVAVLTAAGIVGAGEPDVQWWIPLLPAVLLVGPASRPGRVRRALTRAAARHRLAAMPGRLHPGPITSRGQSVRLVTAAGEAVGVSVSAGVAETLAVQHVGEPALLVWAPVLLGRAAVALLLGGCRVAYLERRPVGVRPVAVEVRLEDREPTLVLARR